MDPGFACGLRFPKRGALAIGQQPFQSPLNLGEGGTFDHQDRDAQLLSLAPHVGITPQLLPHSEHHIGQFNGAGQLHR
jgi:hypothetical protein